MDNCRLLLFDLDGTLLRSDKTVSEKNIKALLKCREKGILIGIATSRGEQNTLSFLNKFKPDILITSGGALVKFNDEYIYRAEFSATETKRMIYAVREVCGADCEITIDTAESHYWNYKIDPQKQDPSWGNSIYTDFENFEKCSLKMCAEIFDNEHAERLMKLLPDCDCKRFSDGYWYKFTKKGITKENAVKEVCDKCGISTDEIIAFGDDFADAGMLELCGIGVAMENSIDDIKAKADIIIGSNDSDSIADFLEKLL